jgi:raffinose/stachyose/melibiose transport system permease protein
VRRVALYVIALVVLGVVIVPILFAIVGGFRTNRQLIEDPSGLPDPWVWSNYTDTLRNGRFWRQVFNSVLIALLTVSIVLPAASMASFVLSRYRFRGRQVLYGLFTLGLLFPVAVAVIPLFVVIRELDLLGNPLGVSLPQAAFQLPLAIVIMLPFLRAIPQELQDAAEIDGCGPWRFYWSIAVPLSRPVLSTIAVHDGLRARARLHRAVDGPGTDLLRPRRTSDRRWPHGRGGQGVSVHPGGSPDDDRR